MRTSPFRPSLALLLCLWSPLPTFAQDGEEPPESVNDNQLWLTFQTFKPLNEKQWVMHFEGRTNGNADEGQFTSVDARSRMNFYLISWLDVFPEVLARYTVENDDVNSTMVNLRGGVRFRVPSTQRIFNRERVPLQRFDFGVLLRLEWRNFFYQGGAHDSAWRARGRVEARFPLNRKSLSADRTLYLRGDAEVFVPFGEEAAESFADRWRFRAGGGYRFSFPWRVEALAVWQRSRDTLESGFESTEFMLNLRLRYYY
jgi:hypothetical protein